MTGGGRARVWISEFRQIRGDRDRKYWIRKGRVRDGSLQMLKGHRRWHRAVAHSGCAYPKRQVRIEGDNKIYERGADSGFKMRFHFCPNCSSTTSWYGLPEWASSNVFWEGDGNPNTYEITVGSFADPNFPPPTYSAWEEVKHPWLGVATATEHFFQGRPLTR